MVLEWNFFIYGVNDYCMLGIILVIEDIVMKKEKGRGGRGKGKFLCL